MPLQPVSVTEVALANHIAQRIVQDIVNVAKRVSDLRTNGLPAVEAQEERVLPDGRVLPARPAQVAVSPAAVDNALGTDNCALLDSVKQALGL